MEEYLEDNANDSSDEIDPIDDNEETEPCENKIKIRVVVKVVTKFK